MGNRSFQNWHNHTKSQIRKEKVKDKLNSEVEFNKYMFKLLNKSVKNKDITGSYVAIFWLYFNFIIKLSFIAVPVGIIFLFFCFLNY